MAPCPLQCLNVTCHPDQGHVTQVTLAYGDEDLGRQTCSADAAMSLKGQWQGYRRGPASNFEMQAPLTGLADPPPNILLVVSPNLHKACAGCYILQANVLANGQPLWKHRGRAYWLFSAPTGHWAIGGEDVKNENFVRSSGWIYQERPHKGLMPDQSSSRWLLFDDEGVYTSDEGFKLTVPIRDEDEGFMMMQPPEVLPLTQKQQASRSPGLIIDSFVGMFMGRKQRRAAA